MGVLMQAAYRRTAAVSVPSPAEGGSVPWWWDHLASQAFGWRSSGISAVLLPPVLKTRSGALPSADGYGVFDDYDLGSKDQYGSLATRFGSRQLLQRCVAVMRTNGLDVYVDTVPHQRQGGVKYAYNYPGAVPHTAGRFRKCADCFYPHVPRDPTAGPVIDDFRFGDELCPINAKAPGYVMNGLIGAGDWITRTLGIQGYRIDDVKGMAVDFVRRWLESKSMHSLGGQHWSVGHPAPSPLRLVTPDEGWHFVNVTGNSTDETGMPFSATVQYSSAPTLKVS